MVLTASAQCKANYGRAPDFPFTYELLRASISLQDRPILEKTIQGAIASREAFSIEYRCTWPDGSEHWIEVNGVPIFDTDGRPYKLGGVTQEITPRKQVENDLREAQSRLTSMLEAIDVGSWAVDLLRDKVTPDRNLTRLFYLTEEEAHGSINNYLRRIHPEDLPMVEAAMQKVFADPNEKYALEYRVCSPNGQLRWIEIRGDVERDADGKPILFRGVVLDITHRKRAEEQERYAVAQMVRAVEQFRILADTMPQMVWSARADGFVDYYNQRWFDYTGLTLEETQGWGWKQVQHPEDVQRSVDKWNHSIATGDVFDNEMRFRRASDQTWRWHFTRAIPVLHQNGSVSQWIGTCTDIHARKETEEVLRNSQQLLETRIQERTTELWLEVVERRRAESELRELSGKILTLRDEEQRRIGRDLHDSVGQYMAAAAMNLGAMELKNDLSESARSSLSQAIHSVQQASQEVRVISYLLHPPLLDEVGLASAIRFYLDGFSERSGIRTEFTEQGERVRLPVEMETAIFRACQESLTNIHRHSGSKVAMIRLTGSPELIQLEVEDTGRGMPDKIFSGVGLRGLRERIAQFSGTTKINSTSTGTTVTVRLPLKKL